MNEKFSFFNPKIQCFCSDWPLACLVIFLLACLLSGLAGLSNGQSKRIAELEQENERLRRGMVINEWRDE